MWWLIQGTWWLQLGDMVAECRGHGGSIKEMWCLKGSMTGDYKKSQQPNKTTLSEK